jgi:hypothetical protein
MENNALRMQVKIFFLIQFIRVNPREHTTSIHKQSSFTTMKEILSIIIRATMQPRYWSDHLNKSNDLECDGRRDGQGKRFYD